MRSSILAIVAVLSLAGPAFASVVTGFNAGGTTANVTAFAPGGGAFPPNISTISATVTPPSPGVDTATIDLTTTEANLGSGLDINRFTWTVTSTLPINQIAFLPSNESANISALIRTVQTAAVPAGWNRIVTPRGLFFNTIGFVLAPPQTIAFTFDIDIRDLTTGPVNELGSFDLTLTAANPEPTSIALSGALVALAGAFGWKKRNKQNGSTEPAEVV